MNCSHAVLCTLQDMWGRIMWLWNRPTFQRLRIAFSMANISVRLPAIIALVGTQIGLLATQVSSVGCTQPSSTAAIFACANASQRGLSGHEPAPRPRVLPCWRVSCKQQVTCRHEWVGQQ